jgi:hypothetical protein
MAISNYHYTVGVNGGLPSIQSAIDRIAADVQTLAPVTEDFIVTVDRGTYGGFKIPAGTLTPLLTSG